MRPLPDGIRADPDSCHPAPASPCLGNLAKLPPDPLAPRRLCNHQPADQNRRLGLEVVFDGEVNPPYDSVIYARYQH